MALSLDDDFEEEPNPKKPERPVLEDDEDDEPPRRARRPGGPSMMPAGSLPAVVLVLIMAGGLVGAAIAGVGAIVALKPFKRAAHGLAAAPPDSSPPDSKGTPEPPDVKGNGEPLPKAIPSIAPEVLAKGVVPIQIPAELATQVVFSGGETGYAAIVTTKPRGVGRMIHVVHTDSGASAGRVGIETVNDAGFAISPDGKSLAVLGESAPEPRGISLFKVASGEMTRTVPYPQAGNGGLLDTVWIDFISKESFLTLTLNGTVEVWSSVTMQRVNSKSLNLPGSLPLEVDAATHCPKNFALSADGKTLAVFNGSGFTFLATDSLQELGRTEEILPPGTRIVFSGAAMNAGGSRFACYYQTFGASGTVAVGVWNAITGKRTTSPSMRAVVPPAGFAWWGSENLIFWKSGLSSCDLFDVKSMRSTGTLQTAIGNRFCPLPATNQAWAVVGGTEGSKAYLVRADLPATLAADAAMEISAKGLQVK